MTKEEFMIEFVLNRASACDGNTGGKNWALSAEDAWNTIQDSLSEDDVPDPESGTPSFLAPARPKLTTPH
jgi:hypothetical protein